MAQVTTLFSAQAANGSSESFQNKGSYVTVSVSGTWDGADISIQLSPNGTDNWVTPPNGTLTEDGIKNVKVAVGYYIRVTLANVGTTSINAYVSGGI